MKTRESVSEIYTCFEMYNFNCVCDLPKNFQWLSFMFGAFSVAIFKHNEMQSILVELIANNKVSNFSNCLTQVEVGK